MCSSRPRRSTATAAIHRVHGATLGLSYRHCGAPEDWIFIGAQLRGGRGRAAPRSRARMAEIQAAREATQPIRARTGGSTFANPPGHKAWRADRRRRLPRPCPRRRDGLGEAHQFPDQYRRRDRRRYRRLSARRCGAAVHAPVRHRARMGDPPHRAESCLRARLARLGEGVAPDAPRRHQAARRRRIAPADAPRPVRGRSPLALAAGALGAARC